MGFWKDIRDLEQQAEATAPREGVAPAEHLLAHGRAASATITAIRETGVTIDDDPTVELDLAVALDGAEPYAVTHRQTLSRIALPSFQPGATIRVRVDPADRRSLMIG